MRPTARTTRARAHRLRGAQAQGPSHGARGHTTPPVFDFDEVQQRVEQAYECEVAAVLPHSEELMVLSSEGIFAQRYPDHEVTGLYRKVATRLMA